jgi:hypothetical protein
MLVCADALAKAIPKDLLLPAPKGENPGIDLNVEGLSVIRWLATPPWNARFVLIRQTQGRVGMVPNLTSIPSLRGLSLYCARFEDRKVL